jgi:Ser/Thr protein kinase RdoA (MazF antagonist)
VPVAKPASRQWYTAEGLTATVWGYVDAVDEPIDWSAVGRAVREVHVLDPGDLPAGYPLPPPSAFPWWDFDRLLVEVADAIDAVALAGLRAVIDRHRGWSLMPDTVICHGDVHPGNVMMTEDGPLLIDWDLMCTAMPGWDHAMLITLAERWGGDANASTAFATGYGTSFAHDERTLALAELRNVAATLMRVKAGLADEAARPEAERRLRFWRGDPDAPLWRAL